MSSSGDALCYKREAVRFFQTAVRDRPRRRETVRVHGARSRGRLSGGPLTEECQGVTMNQNEEKACVVCQRTPAEVPLLSVEYTDRTFRICTQHFPLLVHDPSQLVGKLPGAEKLLPAKHHD